MGRPLNPRYFGNRPGHKSFIPLTRIHDTVQASIIVHQVNKHSYLCRQILTGYQSICKLTNNLETNNSMNIRFQDHQGTIWPASKITNLFVWDFQGQKYTWTFYMSNQMPVQSQVYIIDQGNNP